MTVVAVAQLPLSVGDPDGNRAAAADAVARAAAVGAGLVVLPELSDSGYVFESEAEARGLASRAGTSPTLRQWQVLAGRHRTVIAGGFCELGADGRLYNSAALVDASGTRAVYRKAHLWDAEKLVFAAGDRRPPVVDLPIGRVALLVCYDLEFPEWVRLAALAGADLLAAPVNWPAAPHPPAERPAEIVKAQAGAAVNGVFAAVADRCRAERGTGWIGGSVIIGPDGYPLAGPAGDHAEAATILATECDLTRARDKRASAHNDLMGDRRTELYGPVSLCWAIRGGHGLPPGPPRGHIFRVLRERLVPGRFCTTSTIRLRPAMAASHIHRFLVRDFCILLPFVPVPP